MDEIDGVAVLMCVAMRRFWTTLIVCVVLVLAALSTKGMLAPLASVFFANHVVSPVLRGAIDISSTSAGQVWYGLFHVNPHDVAAHYDLFLKQDITHFSTRSWQMWGIYFWRDLIPFTMPFLLFFISVIWLFFLFKKRVWLQAFIQQRRSKEC